MIISSPPELDDVDEFQDETSLDLAATAKISEVRELLVPAELHGQRLDRMLVAGVPEFSRSYLQQLLEDGAVTRAGLVQLKSAFKVKAGERWQIELRATPQSQAFKPESMALNVVFEDADIRVIDKPTGLVVHPAPGNWSGTLMNGLLGLDPAVMELPRAGIVHRLDKDTSGLMVVARTRQAMDALVSQIAAREVHRQYLALGHKNWTGVSPRTFDAAIGRDPTNRLRMAVVDLSHQSGKTAATTFDLLAQGERCCLVQCTLHTGRTHQIRVHMAHLGHPLLGDAVYGGVPLGGMSRQALHAWRLAFEHPITGQSIDLTSAMPEDMAQAMQNSGLSYNLTP